MTHRVGPPLVPYRDAEPETQAAFVAGLERQRGLDGNPETWHCTVCGKDTDGNDILITYNVETPMPQCPIKPSKEEICVGYGPDLIPVADGVA